MITVFKRELRSFFESPIAYVFLAVYDLFAGIYFFGTVLLLNTTDLRGVYSSLFSITLFLITLLTMRIVSEDLKNKTDQLLLTVPVRLSALIIGKFLAVLAIYTMAISITLVYAVLLSFYAPVDWALILGHFSGLLMLGASIISIGVFISSLTESQVVAAVCSFIVSLALMLLDSFAGAVSVVFIKNLLIGMSFSARYNDFTLGIFSLPNVLFFLSVSVAFLFFTVRVFEHRRWE